MTASAPRELHALGQSLWLDNITRDLLDTGTLRRYVDEFSVTGLTSNPTIFAKAIRTSSSYDDDIRAGHEHGLRGEALLFSLAVRDVVRAAEIIRPIHERSGTVDGFVSLEVSPVFARDAWATVEQARMLHKQADRPNVFIKIPGTPEGLTAIEEAIFAGVPVNVTLLFSTDQYRLAAQAYMSGLERRMRAGLSPDVRSVASLFISRSDVAVAAKVSTGLRNRLGIAIGQQTYRAYREILASDRHQRLANAGAHAQRLLFASTGTKAKIASDTLYVAGLAAPNTINTMPDATLLAFAEHGPGVEPLRADGGDSGTVLTAHAEAGIDLAGLASRLQSEGVDGFLRSWNELLQLVASKADRLVTAG